jgi:hypothetical protein
LLKAEICSGVYCGVRTSELELASLDMIPVGEVAVVVF